MSNLLSTSQIVELSQTLHQARATAQEIEPLTKTFHDFDLSDAYKIQSEGIELRLKEGEKVIGYKMGFTSKAKMEQMGLHQPIFGVLTNKMQVKNKGPFPLKNRIHPKTEPEIYFITNRDLQGSITPDEALAACAQIGVALEILDSRFKGFKYFTLPDVVADNASSAFFVSSALASAAFFWLAVCASALCVSIKLATTARLIVSLENISITPH